MSANYSIRKYSSGDEKNIVKLMELTYGSWKPTNYWYWTYAENPAGFYKELICLAVNGNDYAGHYTIVPTKMLVDGNEILTAQSVDTATNPSYRRMNIFEKTANATYESAVENQIPITYGVAGIGPSYYGFIKKLNWFHVFFFSHFVKVINPQKIIENYTKNKFLIGLGQLGFKTLTYKRVLEKLPDVEFDQVQRFPMEINTFCQKVANEYKFLIKKDQTYLNYRVSNPENKYDIFIAKEKGQIVGYAIITMMSKTFKNISLDNIAIITELITQKDKDYVIPNFLEYLTFVYKKRNADAISCSFQDSHRYSKILNKHGFWKFKSEMGFIVRENYKHPLININELLLEENWYVSQLDTDHV